jgi:hypothetical protein
MLPELTHLPVNWVDGMKITRGHLTDFEHYVTDQVRDSTGVGLTDNSFGVLPAGAASPALTLQIRMDHAQQLHVRVEACRGVTLGGHRVEINLRNPAELHTSVAKVLAEHQLPADKECVLAVVLSVNPFSRIPTGEPRPEEVPPRHPYTLPAYQISLIPFDQIHEASFYSSCLSVGKILYRGQEFKNQADYIPPCTSVLSHPALLNWYRSYGTLLLDIETNAFRIIQKIRARTPSNSLGESIQVLMERLVHTISGLKTNYRWMVPRLPPAYLIEPVLQVVHTCRASIGCLTDREREELLGYFAEWSEVTPGVIDSQIQALTQLSYNHLDVAPLLAAVDEFIRLLAGLLDKLSQLEYIGKRKGQVVFIGENPVGEPGNEKAKTRWSPL